MTDDNLELAQAQYRAGKAAFERGDYRQSVQALEKAVGLAGRDTRLGGEAQVWLVTAYEAAEQRAEAIALCEAITQHPDLKTRKQSRRLLTILKAPRLKTRPEWLTEIPDLTRLEDSSQNNQKSYTPKNSTRPPRPRKPEAELEPIDLSQVRTQDNQFVWLALVASVLVLGGLFWLSQ